MNLYSLVSLCLLPGSSLGLYAERQCWWTWKGKFMCKTPTKKMDGIFCANIWESQRGYPPCCKTWHANCYTCPGIGNFPLRMTKDAEGSPWFKQSKHEDRFNHGIRGAHASIPFQCKDCWMINLEGWLLVPNLDDMYVVLLRCANLDAMLGWVVTTIKAHTSAVKRMVRHCKIITKTPTVPCRGPIEAGESVRMSTAIDMLMGVLVGKSRIKGEWCIQVDSMQKIRVVSVILARNQNSNRLCLTGKSAIEHCYYSQIVGISETRSWRRGGGIDIAQILQVWSSRGHRSVCLAVRTRSPNDGPHMYYQEHLHGQKCHHANWAHEGRGKLIKCSLPFHCYVKRVQVQDGSQAAHSCPCIHHQVGNRNEMVAGKTHQCLCRRRMYVRTSIRLPGWVSCIPIGIPWYTQLLP